MATPDQYFNRHRAMVRQPVVAFLVAAELRPSDVEPFIGLVQDLVAHDVLLRVPLSVLAAGTHRGPAPHAVRTSGQDGQRHPKEHIMSNQILDEAYERLHVTGPEFGGDEEGNNGLSNHGPMAVEVLVRRGHEFDVPRWLDAYVPRLEKLPKASDRITGENWRDALGSGRRVGDWTAFFTSQVSQHPWRGVLATWWPRLLPGIAAGATHGVIRVGHAVRTLLAGDDNPAAVIELAHGLAYWAGRWQAVPGVAAPAGRLDAAAALETVPHLPVQRGVIASRIPKLANLPGWSAGWRRCALPPTTRRSR